MDIESHLRSFTRRDWEEPTDGGPVRFAMVGLGWWTREQAIPAAVDSDYCEPTVLVSRSKEKAESYTDLAESIEHGLDGAEYHDGVAADAYDAVYVCTPNAAHLEYVRTAADLGKGVLCEKPMEASVERARDLAAACADAGVPDMVAYRMQTEPAVRRAKELLGSGLLGDPVSVHGHMSQRLPQIFPDTDHWRYRRELVGPGATIMDIGLYPLNTTRFLLEADPVAVQGATRSPDEAFADVPDEHAAFTLQFPDDVLAACTASQNAYRSSHLKIVGTEGEVTIEPAFFDRQDRRLTVRSGGTALDHTFEQVDQMREEFDYYGNCVLTGRDPYPDAAHGLVDVETMVAIYEAAERGEAVAVAPWPDGPRSSAGPTTFLNRSGIGVISHVNDCQ